MKIIPIEAKLKDRISNKEKIMSELPFIVRNNMVKGEGWITSISNRKELIKKDKSIDEAKKSKVIAYLKIHDVRYLMFITYLNDNKIKILNKKDGEKICIDFDTKLKDIEKNLNKESV